MIGFKSRVAFNGTRTVENSWIQLELYDLSVLCSSTHSSLAMPAVLLLLCSAQSSAVPHNVRFCLKTLKKYSIYTMYLTSCAAAPFFLFPYFTIADKNSLYVGFCFHYYTSTLPRPFLFCSVLLFCFHILLLECPRLWRIMMIY